MHIVGIDLGTTNSLISRYGEGKSELIRNVHGNLLTPSVVSVLENGEIIVGQAAKERLYTHPHMTASAFKRFMGTKRKYTLGRRAFTPVELSALVLKSLKADAEAALGERIQEAVISVPAYFNEQQRRATKQAGELAGLRVERLISEPTAAALAYGLQRSESDIQFLVFDMGGGTLDVSVVELFDNILEVKAVAGDCFLGGEDFDQAISDYFIKSQGLNDRLDAKAHSIIKSKAELAKCALSASGAAQMQVVLGNMAYTQTLTQSDLEKISQPILERIRRPIWQALQDARLKPESLSHVIMVGGSSRMPLVRSFVAKLFERLPLGYIDPDEAVGLGAGVCAAIKARKEDFRERLMTDVCPFTLGTEVLDVNRHGRYENVYLPIIERNSVIPCSKVVRLCNAVDNQTSCRIRIYQGENRKADQNLKLGDMEIFMSPLPAGEFVIDVRYTYDINGLLEVQVTNLKTGKTHSKIIQNSENQLSEIEIKSCLKRLESLKIHPRDLSENQLLLSRAERLYEESLGEKRKLIDKRTRDFEAALDKQEPRLIESASLEFSAFLDEIERRW